MRQVNKKKLEDAEFEKRLEDIRSTEMMQKRLKQEKKEPEDKSIPDENPCF